MQTSGVHKQGGPAERSPLWSIMCGEGRRTSTTTTHMPSNLTWSTSPKFMKAPAGGCEGFGSQQASGDPETSRFGNFRILWSGRKPCPLLPLPWFLATQECLSNSPQLTCRDEWVPKSGGTVRVGFARGGAACSNSRPQPGAKTFGGLRGRGGQVGRPVRRQALQGGSVGTPIYIPQNDPHDALIIWNIHNWGKKISRKNFPISSGSHQPRSDQEVRSGVKFFCEFFHPFVNSPPNSEYFEKRHEGFKKKPCQEKIFGAFGASTFP